MFRPLTGELLDAVRRDAETRLEADHPAIRADELLVYAWPQTWPSTACGFGGVGGQAMTTAPTIVVVGPGHEHLVYHAGRHAATLRRPSDEFMGRFQAMDLPGASPRGWWARQETAPRAEGRGKTAGGQRP